jgi:hypothetical protein
MPRSQSLPKVLLLLVLISWACTKDNALDTDQGSLLPPSIVPLAVGNRWIYQYSYMDDAGTVLESYTDTTTIPSDTNTSSGRWFLARWLIEPTFGANRSTGFTLLDGYREVRPGAQPALLYRYPSNKGDHYQHSFLPSDPPFTITVIDTATAVTTPAGTFICYKYLLGTLVRGSEQYVGYHYLSPGVGRVLIESIGFTQTGPYVQSRSQLVAYSPSNAAP